MNTDNLRTLAEYLLTVPEERFDMLTYTENESPDDMAAARNNYCGTTACAAGHAASVWPEVAARHADNFGSINYGWMIFSLFGISVNSIEFKFLFGDAWSRVANSPKQAAARIFYAIDQAAALDMDMDKANLGALQLRCRRHFKQNYTPTGEKK